MPLTLTKYGPAGSDDTSSLVFPPPSASVTETTVLPHKSTIDTVTLSEMPSSESSTKLDAGLGVSLTDVANTSSID